MSNTLVQCDHDSASGSVSQWLAALRSKQDEETARKLFQRYFQAVRRVVGGQLSGFNSRLFDDEDLAVMVIDILIRGLRHGKFDHTKDRHHLWALMMLIARRQVLDRIRDQRDVLRDSVPLEAEWLDSVDENPAFQAEFKDLQLHLFDCLPNHQLREIAAGKLRGDTNAQLAARFGLTIRSIQRKVCDIYERWEKRIDG